MAECCDVLLKPRSDACFTHVAVVAAWLFSERIYCVKPEVG